MSFTSNLVTAPVTFDFHAPGGDILKKPDLVVTQLYEWNTKMNPNYPLFLYHDGEERRYITYSSAEVAITRAARYVFRSVNPHGDVLETLRPVVGILANTDTITFFCTVLGALKSGFTVFLISTRNSAAAIADMVQRMGVGHMLVSLDTPMQTLMAATQALLSRTNHTVVQHPMPAFEDLYSTSTDPANQIDVEIEMPTSYDMEGPALIMHSSGSMGHPKPIAWAHKRLAVYGQHALQCEIDVRGSVMGCHGVPMFHGMGAFMYSAAPTAGFIVAAFRPASPPTAPTPEAVWSGIVATNADFSFSVPSFVEQWARDPEKVVMMKKMRGLLFGGAVMNEEVGNSLAAQGITLQTVYGMTEVGLVNTFVRPNPGLDWQYWSVSPEMHCTFRAVENKTYEVIVISHPELPLPKTNTKVGELDAYASSDLAVPHPTIPDLWKIIGRADEQIILSNGEKTNPLPLEKMINDDPRVKCSVMFGRGKFQNGVLIEPTEDFAFDVNNTQQLVGFRNAIWPTIEYVNEYAPQHSRIFKEMILVADPLKPFQFNAKGLLRRGIILDDYKDEIEALYEEVENSARSDVDPPATWDLNSILAFVHAVVESTLRRPIPDNADIFRNGGDSLQATWIRNTVLSAMRTADQGAAKGLPMNLVFAFPTIGTLAGAIHNAMHSAQNNSGNVHVITHTPEDLWKYVKRYSLDLPSRPACLVAPQPGRKDVVVITGTTGGFGCDALEHLLRDERVERVYAFNRANSHASERQRAQFRARGLDEALLYSEKFTMVEAVLQEPGFGIAQEMLEEIRGSVTHIILNAWKVDFNMSISSFDVDMQGARNFVDLALSSPSTVPPPIIFVSSIGVFSNYKLVSPVPEIPLTDPASPFGSGYCESKWVTEHVLENVSGATDVHTVVVRLGQVTGDKLGYWNEKEWFPSLVKTALHQHCLPDIDGTVSWFPSYEAAKALTEMRDSPESFLHLVHPHPVPWHTLIAPIATALHCPLVPYEEWLAKLEASVNAGSANEIDTMASNPALRILSFFQGVIIGKTASPDKEPMGLVKLSTAKSTQTSKALASLPALDAKRALSWVAGWKKAGFL